MKSNKSLMIIILVTISISLSVLSGCTTQENNNNTTKPTNSDTGDNFSFTLLDESTQELKDHRGKVVIMDLWATWCQPCQYQMLELEKAYKAYSRDNLEILSINTDSRESLAQISDFIDQFEEYGYDLDWVFANELDDLGDYNLAGSIPRLVIFDQEGHIYWEHNGLIFFNQIPDGWTGETTLLKEKIDELIN